MSRPTKRDRARNVYADALLSRGREWRNAAESVRAGFENVWITSALDAVERLLLLCGDDADEGSTESARA